MEREKAVSDEEFQAREKSYRDALEVYKAENKKLLNRALVAENSAAALASENTQLMGHHNSKQRIHYLEKLRQDNFNLRKELREKSLAFEKEKKCRQKAEARIKELSQQKKYNPSEAFKVPEIPSVAVTKTPRGSLTRPSTSAEIIKEAPKVQRKPLGENKENVSRGSIGLFPRDISAIQEESPVNEMIFKNKLIKSRTDNVTSTPL